jgi:hypothetical protein
VLVKIFLVHMNGRAISLCHFCRLKGSRHQAGRINGMSILNELPQEAASGVAERVSPGGGFPAVIGEMSPLVHSASLLRLDCAYRGHGEDFTRAAL